MQQSWQLYDVPDDAVKLAKAAAHMAKAVQQLGPLPDGIADVRYAPGSTQLFVNFFHSGDKSAAVDFVQGLRALPVRQIVLSEDLDDPTSPTVKLASTDFAQRIRQKQATSATLRGIAEGLHVVPGKHNWLPGGASPLTSMLAGGMLGAASGYGLGVLGEQLLPESWQRGNLRRTLAMLGGTLGIAPGATIGLTNLGRGKGFNDSGVQNHPGDVLAKAAEVAGRVKRGWGDLTGLEASRDFYTPSFNPDYAAQQIWSQPLPTYTRAAMAGLTEGAKQHAAASGATLVTPMDVAKMTAGMGSGYLSGMLVGKAMGAMFGAPPQTQQYLRNTGMLAGVIANLMPVVFRGTR